MASTQNVDPAVVQAFGREWRKFDHTALDRAHLQPIFESYFRGFPWDALPCEARGFDMGCGSGRWARFVAERVFSLTCVDPSAEALRVARENLASLHNCQFELGTASNNTLPEAAYDFGYSLGVLHHVPDTGEALRSCVTRLKPGAPFLLYLYYGFDNRPIWFRALWKLSNVGRRAISRLPFGLRSTVCELIAAIVYWPLARLARGAERCRFNAEALPLAAYRSRPFYAMRTDALDRFGTRLEKRFARDEIAAMMQAAGLTAVRFSDAPPYWCAVGFREH
jgi:SAM-dependent methyltransferase